LQRAVGLVGSNPPVVAVGSWAGGEVGQRVSVTAWVGQGVLDGARVQVGIWVMVGVRVMVGVSVMVAVRVMVAVTVEVAVGVAVGVAVRVTVLDGVAGISVGMIFTVGVRVGVGVVLTQELMAAAMSKHSSSVIER
jgi:hypothetical protein